ncbi:MAG: DUF1493 family protein [Paracoccaceae bacterium]
MPSKVTRSEVVEFITERLHKHFRVKLNRYGKDATIAGDMGVDGDDARELIMMINEEFEVRIDEVLQRSFWPESGLVFSGEVVPITIQQLAHEVIELLDN